MMEHTQRAWRDPDLSAHELLVMLAIANYAGADGKCWPTLARLASDVHLSADTVRRCIRALVRRRKLVLEERGGRGLANVTTIPGGGGA